MKNVFRLLYAVQFKWRTSKKWRKKSFMFEFKQIYWIKYTYFCSLFINAINLCFYSLSFCRFIRDVILPTLLNHHTIKKLAAGVAKVHWIRPNARVHSAGWNHSDALVSIISCRIEFYSRNKQVNDECDRSLSIKLTKNHCCRFADNDNKSCLLYSTTATRTMLSLRLAIKSAYQMLCDSITSQKSSIPFSQSFLWNRIIGMVVRTFTHWMLLEWQKKSIYTNSEKKHWLSIRSNLKWIAEQMFRAVWKQTIYILHMKSPTELIWFLGNKCDNREINFLSSLYLLDYAIHFKRIHRVLCAANAVYFYEMSSTVNVITQLECFEIIQYVFTIHLRCNEARFWDTFKCICFEFCIGCPLPIRYHNEWQKCQFWTVFW